MIEDKMFDRDELGDDEWMLTPEPDDIIPESVEYRQTESELRAAMEDDPHVVVLTHTDADGYGSGAVAQHYFDSWGHVQAIGYHDAFGLLDALELVSEYSPANVLVADLCPDTHDFVEAVSAIETGWMAWFDHHQWDDEIYREMRGETDVLLVDEDECATTILCQYFGVESGFIQEFAEVTKDRDLWIRDDPRSDNLSAYSRMVDIDEYIDTVLKYGADLPEQVIEQIELEKEEDRKIKDFAVENATYREVAGLNVAVTYVSGGVSSEIGNELCENEDADVVFVQRPSGGVSIYSHSNRETFDQCHEVAGNLGGGGHPTAAGGGHGFDRFRELTNYWSSAGSAYVNDPLLQALREVVE